MQNKRRRKLIDSRLQFRTIGAFVSISAVAMTFQVVLLNQALVDLSVELGPQGGSVLARTPEILGRTLIGSTLVLLPLSYLAGILITHKIAGPAYRMRQHCKAVARGEHPGPCKLRSGDELQDLCDALNEALDATITEPEPQALDTPSGVEVSEEPPSLVDGHPPVSSQSKADA